MEADIVIREQVQETDRAEVARLCVLAGNFSGEEIRIAEELVDEYLTKGPASGYFFRFAQGPDRVLGYICYGPIPGSETSWNIYWLVVDSAAQRLGLGDQLLQEAEADAALSGGERFYVDTSSRPDYTAARLFYLNRGFELQAQLKDFYRAGDDRIIYEKGLTAESAAI